LIELFWEVAFTIEGSCILKNPLEPLYIKDSDKPHSRYTLYKQYTKERGGVRFAAATLKKKKPQVFCLLWNKKIEV